MPAITDYGSLKAAIQIWAARSDAMLVGQIDTLISLAEDRIYSGGAGPGDALYTPPLRSSIMETTATVPLVNGTGVLPLTCLDVIKLYPQAGTIGTTALSPERFAEQAAHVSGGPPLYHTIEAGALKVLPALTGDVALTYYQRFPGISSAVTTGALIAEHGNIYLMACLFEAFTLLQEGELAGAYLSKLKSLIVGANRVTLDRLQVGPLRVHPRRVIGA